MAQEPIKLEELSEEQIKEIKAIWYALSLIREKSGYGSLEITVKDGEVIKMAATCDMLPKYMSV